jgi:DNA mismatch repair protein MutH
VKAPPPPRDEADLLARAEALAGRTVGELAARAGRPVPADPRRGKGLAGELVERALGARGGSAAGPDLPALGVEIKTLPLRPDGRVVESTYVCTAPLDRLERESWASSAVRAKLARVLFVPVERRDDLPPGAARVGAAWLWSPSAEQEAALREDWERVREAYARGGPDAVHGRLGVALQVRPKAAHGGVRAVTFDEEGAPVRALPRGFYLRARFTESLVRATFARQAHARETLLRAEPLGGPDGAEPRPSATGADAGSGARRAGGERP